MKNPLPDQIIIGLLRYRPMHGYEIINYFREKSQLGRIWTMSTSQIYAVLKRLEKNGAIVGEQINEPDSPSKTVYSVTPIGIKLLENWLYEKNPSTSIHLIRVIFNSRLYIAELLNYQMDKIIKNQKIVCNSQLLIAQNSIKECKNQIETLTVDYIIRHLETTISWLEDCEKVLLQMERQKK
jgi:DNA-binding PadR family transcriptional regulator